MAETANIMLPGAPNYPVPGAGGLGQVSGGLLRPGAIDQARFQEILAAQQGQTEVAAPPGMTLNDYRKLAGRPVGPEPTPPPEPQAPVSQGAMIDGIPNLTAEQFAVLTGMNPANAAPPAEPPAPDSAPQAVTPPPIGAPLEMVPPELQAQLAAAIPAAPESEAMGEAEIAPEEAVAITTGDEAAADERDAAETGDPRVVWMDRVPDRDERRELVAAGKRWRLRETPGANELFLGPDGKFGWDDFIDIINPLQHIPVVAQIYRAVTGDQAYAASQFAGAIPFGPLSAANAVLDTMIRSQTGRDAGTDLAAAIIGVDNRTPEEANLHLATPSGDLAGGAPAAAPDIESRQVAALRDRNLGYDSGAGDRG